MSSWVQFLASLSGLAIRLGSCVAAAIAQAAATAPIWPLAWDPPHAVGAALKKDTHTKKVKKKKKKKKKKENYLKKVDCVRWLSSFFWWSSSWHHKMYFCPLSFLQQVFMETPAFRMSAILTSTYSTKRSVLGMVRPEQRCPWSPTSTRPVWSHLHVAWQLVHMLSG